MQKSLIKAKPKTVWSVARTKFGMPKLGDLLLRLLRQKVAVESWNWIPVPQQESPIHGIGFAIAHTWIDYTVSATV